MPLKPASTFIPSRAPIADKDGMATWSFIKILQDWDTKLRNGLNSIGQIIQDIPATTKVVGRGALGAILQFIDDSGQVLAGGIDFARDYINKDTDHIADGTGNPLAGGKAAYTVFVGSHPVAGETLRFDGTNWLPVPIAVSKPSTTSEWLNSYDAATGTFTATEPGFSDLTGQLDSSQIPTPTISTLGGVEAINPVASNWVNSINLSGVPQLSQPVVGDVIGAAPLASPTFTGTVGTAGLIFSSAQVTVSALASATVLVGSGGAAGLLVMRDNSLGGSALFLIDPNVGAQLIGASNISGMSSSSNVVWNGSNWTINISSGSVPRTIGWSIYGT